MLIVPASSHALFYASQAKTAAAPRRIEPDAVVADGDRQPIVIPGHAHADRARVRVSHAIGQRLLDRAKHAGPIAIGQGLQVAARVEIHVDAVPVTHVANEPFEGGLEAEIVEHARAKPEGEIAHRPEHLIDQPAALGDRGSDVPVAAEPRPFDAAKLHPQRREHLGHVVMQLAREVPPLLLLRRHQLLRELAHLAFGVFGDRPLFVRAALERRPESRVSATAMLAGRLPGRRRGANGLPLRDFGLLRGEVALFSSSFLERAQYGLASRHDSFRRKFALWKIFRGGQSKKARKSASSPRGVSRLPILSA